MLLCYEDSQTAWSGSGRPSQAR